MVVGEKNSKSFSIVLGSASDPLSDSRKIACCLLTTTYTGSLCSRIRLSAATVCGFLLDHSVFDNWHRESTPESERETA
jgi:hypothetical protein